MKPLFFVLFLSFFSTAQANSLDDVFTVKKIEDHQATLEGKPKSLKAGDSLYFIRSPFKFKILSVSEETVTIELPSSNDVQVNNTMVRNPTESIKRAIKTESDLKSALGD